MYEIESTLLNHAVWYGNNWDLNIILTHSYGLEFYIFVNLDVEAYI